LRKGGFAAALLFFVKKNLKHRGHRGYRVVPKVRIWVVNWWNRKGFVAAAYRLV
jgi:hypothetical protein